MSHAQTVDPTHEPALGPSGISAGDVLRILRKKVWLILACVVVIGGGGIAALILWYQYAPLYTAEGLIAAEASPGGRVGPYDPVYGRVAPQLFEPFMRTEVARIQSTEVLRAALINMREDPRTPSPNTYLDANNVPRVPLLSEEIVVAYIPGSQTISVSLTGQDREEVQGIVRHVLDAYIEHVRNWYNQESVRQQQDLRRAEDDLQRQASELASQLRAFQDETEDLLEGRGEIMGRLQALVGQLVVQQRRLAEERAAYEQFLALMRAAQEEGVGTIALTYPVINEQMRRDPTLAATARQAAQATETLDALKQRYGERHEVVQRQEQRLQALTNELEQTRTNTLNELLQQQQAVLQASYERTRKTLVDDLEPAVADARAKANRLEQRVRQYQDMLREYERVQQQLDQVVTGLERMRIEQSLAQPIVRVLQYPPPVEEDDVSQPRLMLYIPAALFFSIFLGIGLSILIELADAKLRTPSQVVRQVGLPILGCVPDLAEDERLAMNVEVSRVTQSAPESLLAEAFRQFRNSLRFASDTTLKTILITSPNPGDGKTVTAANLATALARSGIRVLLVEANLRRPTLARVFDLPDRVGLSNVLVGLNSLEEAVQATRVENLDVLVGGPMPPSPADLLGSDRMREVLEEAGSGHDCIIVDAAAMLVVADAHLLVQAVDGVVLVLRAGQNTRGLAVRAARMVLDLRARLLGAVLNGVRATRGGYFREAYQAYYDYSGEGPASSMLATSTAARPTARPQASAAEAMQQDVATALAEPEEQDDEAELLDDDDDDGLADEES